LMGLSSLKKGVLLARTASAFSFVIPV